MPKSKAKPPTVPAPALGDAADLAGFEWFVSMFKKYEMREWQVCDFTKSLCVKSAAVYALVKQVAAADGVDGAFNLDKVFVAAGSPAGKEPAPYLAPSLDDRDADDVSGDELAEVRPDGTSWAGFQTALWFCEFVDPEHVTPVDLVNLIY